MIAVLLSCCACLIQFLFGMLLPGLFLQFVGMKLWGNKKELSPAQLLVQTICIGSVYLALQMLLVFWMCQLGAQSAVVLIVTKCLLDLLCSGFWNEKYRNHFRSLVTDYSPLKWHRASQIQLAIALLFSACGVFFVPHGLDNSAVGWLTRFLEYPQLKLISSQGSISYLGFLFAPTLVLKGLVPVPTVACCLKIPLAVLVALVARRVVESLQEIASLNPRTIPWLGLAVQLMVLTTPIGKYGIFESGKQTVFAMLFFFALAAELIEHRTADKSRYFRIGLVLAAAIGFSPMAVPYCLILMSTYVVFSLGGCNPMRLLFACLACAFPALLVSMHAMLDWSWTKCTLVLAMPLIVAALTTRSTESWSGEKGLTETKMGYRFSILCLLLAIVTTAWLMPLNFYRGMFPLDGEANIINLIMDKNKFDWLGVIGVICFFGLSQFRKNNPGMMSLVCFPFFAAVPALLMASFYEPLGVPLHPQNIWDWVKDIPRWISGFYLCTFCVFAWQTARHWNWNTSRFNWADADQSLQSSRWPMIATIAMIILLCVDARMIFKRAASKGWPSYSSVGGHQDKDLAEFVEWAYLEKWQYRFFNYDSHPLIISDDSAATNWLPALSMYGVRTESVSNYSHEEVNTQKKYWCLCSPDEFESILEKFGWDDRFSTKLVKTIGDEQIFQLNPLPQRTAHRSTLVR